MIKKGAIMNIKYKKEHGAYCLYENERLLFMSTEISVLYDVDEFVLLKHGQPENVKKAYEKYKEKGLNAKLEVVTSDSWNVDELNKILSTSGYVRYLDDELRNPLAAKSRFVK